MVRFIDLPAELVVRIIDVAEASFMDDVTFPISHARKMTLLKFSRVSRAWRVPSQMALHRRLFLVTDAGARRFIECPIAGRYPTRFLQLAHLTSTLVNLVLDKLIVRQQDRAALQVLKLFEVERLHVWSLCHPALRDLKDLQVLSNVEGSMPPDLLTLRLHKLGFRTSFPYNQPGVLEAIIAASRDTLEHIKIGFLDSMTGIDITPRPLVMVGPTLTVWTELNLVASRLLGVCFAGLLEGHSNPCKRFLANCSNLVEFELDGSSLVETMLEALSPHARLRKLAVGQNNRETQWDLDPSQAPKTVLRLKRILPQLSKLRQLELTDHTRMTVRRLQRSGDMDWLADLQREHVHVQFPEPINEHSITRSVAHK
ncbi:BQ2448_5965 [Microbotryum intermedium]|uniref:BQ2448_5965 protein n=1 Tax=Microbotryum intermedium TaxID=269621 RepID=A0A238F3L2_9BASI|nr:BQ2448_5965 [Microbotryum intermedium]